MVSAQTCVCISRAIRQLLSVSADCSILAAIAAYIVPATVKSHLRSAKSASVEPIQTCAPISCTYAKLHVHRLSGAQQGRSQALTRLRQ
nr:hypothetical protein CFP56_13222 [Quercus suber]